MLNIGFVLFMALAVLLVINGLRAFLGGAEATGGKPGARQTAYVTGTVSLLTAVALAFLAFYMFRF